VKSIALHNMKGGVGKTTAAVHLAHLSARAGKKTLLWDLDAQGAASWYFRVRVAESTELEHLLTRRATLWSAMRGSDWPELDVLPADLSLRELERGLRREEDPGRAFAAALVELGQRYERVVLDCPPALTQLTQCVLEAVDAVVVPTIPTALSLRTLATLHGHLKPLRKRGLLVLPFFSMVDERKAVHRRVRDFARAEGLGFLRAEIPHSTHVESSAARREPLTAGAAHPVAEAFEALAGEIEQALSGAEPLPKLGRGRVVELVESLQRPRRRPPRSEEARLTSEPDDELEA
jgi:cellulose biosynthesis protein BcsQ